MPARLPIAILLPHCGLDVPRELLGRVSLNACDLFNEADIYTDLIYDFRDEVACWLTFPYARAMIDVNRSTGHNHSRPGDGIVKTQTSYGIPVHHPGQAPGAELEHSLIDRYWRPWHQQLATLAADPRIRLVIDCHSMAATGPGHYDDPGARRPRACVANLGDHLAEPALGRRHPTAPPALARDFAAKLGRGLADLPTLAPASRDVGINTPFAGGWNIWAHAGKSVFGHPPQVWLMVEVSRGLYVGPQACDSPVRPPNRPLIDTLRARLWQAIIGLYEESGR